MPVENSKMPVVNAFWIGPSLGKMHVACLKSFMRVGHTVVLHTFDQPPVDTPRGVQIADASVLMPADRIVRHAKTGSLALAADIFRFELLAAGRGIYVDCDCYCVRPLEDVDYLFGWESTTIINVAVLKLPASAGLLEDMRQIGRVDGFIPPWLRRHRRLRYQLRAVVGKPVPLANMPWGTLGPSGFTYYAKKHGADVFAAPTDFFYPVHYEQRELLRDPGVTLDDIITPRTRIVHLWNEAQRVLGEPPHGSPLQKIISNAGE